MNLRTKIALMEQQIAALIKTKKDLQRKKIAIRLAYFNWWLPRNCNRANAYN